MTPELEALIKLFAAVQEAPADEQNASMRAFRTACADMAAKTNHLKSVEVEAYAKRAYHKMVKATARRTGQPSTIRTDDS